MDCNDALSLIADAQRGDLAPDRRAELDAHLATCTNCRREADAEAALTDALRDKLPRRVAPVALQRRLARIADPVPPAREARRRSNVVAYAVAAVAVLAALFVLQLRSRSIDALAEARLRDEAVNDHLRILDGDAPLAIVSSGIHEVKPWFAGKLDFAPARAFAGNDDFPLRGGNVTHFLDRKAAAFVYGRRLHTISLFVFRAEGLAWPRTDLTSMGRVEARVAAERGFSTVVWRDGELGYALASDIDPKELLALGALVAGTN
jgi:anti-sigma factor (TIGR02949 family)